MDQPSSLFELSRLIDRTAAAQRFATEGIIQIREVLTPAAANAVHHILARETAWGLAWQAADDGPHGVRAEELAQMPAAQQQRISHKLNSALRGYDYGFAYAQYRMLDAYLEQWSPGGPHDLLLEHINSAPFLDLVRDVTGIPELIKADAQATLYAPNQFLAEHDDSHAGESPRVAYVFNFCAENWRPDWGGYLMFYDQEGDVVAGFKPRFNALNLFRVPHTHNVTYVPPFAPIARFAISGWFRDR